MALYTSNQQSVLCRLSFLFWSWITQMTITSVWPSLFVCFTSPFVIRRIYGLNHLSTYKALLRSLRVKLGISDKTHWKRKLRRTFNFLDFFLPDAWRRRYLRLKNTDPWKYCLERARDARNPLIWKYSQNHELSYQSWRGRKGPGWCIFNYKLQMLKLNSRSGSLESKLGTNFWCPEQRATCAALRRQ